MINKVLWMFFRIFIYIIICIPPFLYCSGHVVVPVKLEIKNAKNSSTLECSVTHNPIKINKGETIGLVVTSPILIHHSLCPVHETDHETIIKHIPKANGKQKDGFHHNNFTLYVSNSGNWWCKFYTHHGVEVIKPIEIIGKDKYTVATCDLAISINEPMIESVGSLLMGLGIGLSWLIIPLIVGIVCCFKRRARPVHDLKSLSAMQRPKNDRARYSGAPLKKPLIPMEITERESGIYEALETIQDAAKMNSVDGIPATASNTNISKDTAETAKSKEKYTFTNVCKIFSSHRRGRKTVQDEDTNDGIVRFTSDGNTTASRKQAKEEKRTTLERIKGRPRLSLPPSQDSDEEYEAMSPVPPARTPIPTRTKPPIPSPKSPEASKNELKSTLKKKLPAPPTKPPEKLAKPIPAPPTQKKTLKSPFITNAETVNELESVLKKKGIGSASTTTASARPKGPLQVPSLPIHPATPKPSPLATLPKPSGPKLPPAPCITRKPTNPSPMDAPVPPPISTLPRPTPSIPVQEPEEDDCEWDGEDWTYEPLPPQNIYSV